MAALVVGVLLAPATASADEKTLPRSTTLLRTSLDRVAAAEHHRPLDASTKAPKNVRRQSTPAQDPKLESGSFFRTRAGAAVLVAFGAGVGYAVYSASNDRIRSSGR